MRKNFKKIHWLGSFLILFVFLLALPLQANAAKASIKLNASKKSITVGKKVTLKATVTGKSKEVTWKSSKKSVATVSASGVVTAKKAGKTTITAKANGKTAKCVVTVKKKAETIDLGIGIGPNTKSELKKLLKKVSGLKAKKSSKYPDLYYKGSKVTVGYNYNAVYGTKNDTYLYVKNTGNPYVTVFDIQIGDTKSAVQARLKQIGNEVLFTPVYKNGKLAQYTYYCKPTSR